MSVTKYQPTAIDGTTGPIFDFMTSACLWIIEQRHPSIWDAKLIRAEALAS